MDLQFPLMANELLYAVLVQSFSALTSLLSLSWSLVSYQKTLRYAMPDKPQLSVGGAASIFLWHTGQVMARVIALALFAKEFKVYVFILLGAHWALMTSWILGQVNGLFIDSTPVPPAVSWEKAKLVYRGTTTLRGKRIFLVKENAALHIINDTSRSSSSMKANYDDSNRTKRSFIQKNVKRVMNAQMSSSYKLYTIWAGKVSPLMSSGPHTKWAG